jgi:hypothetical protein
VDAETTDPYSQDDSGCASTEVETMLHLGTEIAG